jgi:predicted O-methyltransferase YrrM
MRKHTTIAILLLALAAGWGWSQRRGPGRERSAGEPPQAKDAAEAKVLAILARMATSGETYLDVGAANGRLLRILVETNGARQVAEIGSSTGYSGLWLALGLGRTGGHLTTFELDAKRAAEARAHYKEAGVDAIVRLVEGDAHQNVKVLQAPLDLVFIDADKEGYSDYLAKVLPLVRPGGILVADNVDMAPDYAAAVTRNPELDTVFVNGMSITLKKR